jgi:chromatin segregation and condensation protein Rec8/ScpA/Scc1 (kleisin family)
LPERTGLLLGTEHAVDVIAFLWASLALFEDDTPDPDTVTRYRPSWSDLYSVTEAQDRILRVLGEGGHGEELGRFLPEPPVAAEGEDDDEPLRLYAAWATTFSASLELAKQGDVAMAQADAFEAIHVRCPTTQPSDETPP